MKRLADAHVAVVGLGLMGGSLAGALRGHCRRVIGVARREETIVTALERGLIDKGATNLAAGLRRADVVILATPVGVILRQLAEIVAGGFRDILRVVDTCQHQLRNLARLIETEERDEMFAALSTICKKRKEMFP